MSKKNLRTFLLTIRGAELETGNVVPQNQPEELPEEIRHLRELAGFDMDESL